jgi:N6-adenosine-specific RNA methylase IME4
MVQRRLYPDRKTQHRELIRRGRKSKKPYYAKRAQVRRELEEAATIAQKEIAGVYDVIVIDPPWPVAVQGRKLYPNRVALDYPTMSVEAIQALRLPMAETCHVWIWTTQRFLPDAIRCLEGWGLRYVCCFIWRKPDGMQPMHLPKFNCEFVLYARKGAATFIDTTSFFTCFDAPRAEHSVKPDAFYAIVRRVTAGRRLDMFGRRAIEGFESWGHEAPTS